MRAVVSMAPKNVTARLLRAGPALCYRAVILFLIVSNRLDFVG
jgi:hypothetical protein